VTEKEHHCGLFRKTGVRNRVELVNLLRAASDRGVSRESVR
jgi:hypothetical protein